MNHVVALRQETDEVIVQKSAEVIVVKCLV